MSIGKVTTTVDIVDVKTPGALIVAFKQNAGNNVARNLGDLLPNHYVTKQMYFDNMPGVAALIRQSFTTTDTASGNLVINWQTAIPTGQTQTYQQLFANLVEPQVFIIPWGAGGGFAQGSANVSWTTDSSGNVLIVTIAIGSPQNGYVRFG